MKKERPWGTGAVPGEYCRTDRSRILHPDRLQQAVSAQSYISIPLPDGVLANGLPPGFPTPEAFILTEKIGRFRVEFVALPVGANISAIEDVHIIEVWNPDPPRLGPGLLRKYLAARRGFNHAVVKCFGIELGAVEAQCVRPELIEIMCAEAGVPWTAANGIMLSLIHI